MTDDKAPMMPYKLSKAEKIHEKNNQYNGNYGIY